MASPAQVAIEIARRVGIITVDPLVLQETNNTVVWLRPEPVVAKVAVRTHSQLEAHLEHAVASELAALGAEIGRPVSGASPVTHTETGFVVTLWERLEGSDRIDVPAAELATSLRRLHAALDQTEVELPSFRTMLTRARRALDDEAHMAALAEGDHQLLRNVYDSGCSALEGATYVPRRLHGEPHGGNRIKTEGGLRWIDFESCCTGPLEWDLAFQPEDVVSLFPQVNWDLLALLRRLNSARVATWCWGSAHHPEMRRHAEQHTALLRRPPGSTELFDIP